ncbi:MAG: cobalt-precorrin-6A reductase [Rhodospirillaceae bacterium]|nr:cobalt-precorrin-6A reductase [Rhodospirillales bacterium]
MKLLILGGTTEASRVAHALAGSGVDVITSLAGRTANAAVLPGAMRVGGFGGVEGLSDYLTAHSIDRVMDATHPFAARISAHAAQACARLGVPRLMLVRPAWQQQPGDDWVQVADMTEAAQRVATLGRRAFLTVGIGEVAAFAHSPVWFLVRLIADQALPLADYRVITGKGPFDAQAEQDLMRVYGIDLLVTKASGGAATYGKIAAARALGIKVLMVQRPVLPDGEQADSVDAAVAWATSPA